VPHLNDNAIKVMEVLERHPRLDTLQIASRAELSVSAAGAAIEELAQHSLVTDDDGVYSLNTAALGELLETA
jgi:hypothetical protein